MSSDALSLGDVSVVFSVPTSLQGRYFPVASQVGHFTGAGVSLDNRSLFLTCWLCCPGISGRAG